MRVRARLVAVATIVVALASLPAHAAFALVDVTASLTSSASEIVVHHPVTFTLTVTNAGPMGADGVVIHNTFPSDSRVTSLHAPSYCRSADGVLSCDVGSLASSDEITITFTVVTDIVAELTDDVSAGSDDIDLGGGNNADESVVKVDPVPESQREATVLAQINTLRSTQGESALKSDATLNACARSWAQSMASSQTLAHDPDLVSCSGGGTYWVGQDVGNVAYEWDVFGAWMDSCDHRAVLVYAHATHLGLAVAYGGGSEWWVLDLADKVSTDAEPVTTLQNSCFDDSAIGDGVAPGNVRTFGKWFTYHQTGGATSRGAVSVDGVADYYMSIKDPDPGIASATQVVRGAAGKKYTLAGWTKYQSGSTSQSLQLEFLNSSWSRLAARTVATSRSTKEWAAITTGAVIAPTGTTYVRATLLGPSTAGYASTFWWDEIELTRS